MTSDEFDVVVVGAGSGGVNLAQQLVRAGRSVAVVADGFVGGECAYVACMPSKSLLRSARARHEARTLRRHGGASIDPELDDPAQAWTAAVARRDSVAAHRDDTEEAQALEKEGITVVRGHGRLDGPGRVRVGDRVLTAPDVVLDTGSLPVVPPIDGLEDVPTWTSDQALSTPERPERLLVLGAGPIGCELSQAYAAFGVEVIVVDTADRPVPKEDPALGAAMRTVLEAGGVHFEFGAEVTGARAENGGAVLVTKDGRELRGDRVLVVVGRRPNTDDLGLETVDVSTEDDGSIGTDEYCRVKDGLWAVGDVTNLAPYTHTANHQAYVVLDRLLDGPDHTVTPDAIPRAVFTEPALAATGLTEQQARDRGIDVVVAEVDLADTSRAGGEGEGPLGPEDASGGLLRLIADARRRVLVGAGAIGPNADSWITEATVAIRAEVPLFVMGHVIRPFPTYEEAYLLAYRSLREQLDG